jgi:hypothetical protein
VAKKKTQKEIIKILKDKMDSVKKGEMDSFEAIQKIQEKIDNLIEDVVGKKKDGIFELIKNINPLHEKEKSLKENKKLLKKKGFTENQIDTISLLVGYKYSMDFFKSDIDKNIANKLKAIEKKEKKISQKEKESLVKIGLYSELQKFGKRSEKETELYNSLNNEEKKKAENYKISVIGIDHTVAQNTALFAVQKIFSSTSYKGNVKGINVEDYSNVFAYRGFLPAIQMTPAQYLEAYGVEKKKSKRGKMEFNPKERKDALQALRDLAEKQYIFCYERKYYSKKHKESRYKFVRTVSQIIQLKEEYTELTENEKNHIKEKSGGDSKTQKKLKTITIFPSPILLDQIETHFILKCSNYLDEIKELGGRRSKYTEKFIDYLITQATLKRKNKNFEIRISEEELAYKLRMDSYIKKRDHKRIKSILTKCYEAAIKLNYILEHRTQTTTKQIEVFVLNPEKFDQIREKQNLDEKDL